MKNRLLLNNVYDFYPRVSIRRDDSKRESHKLD